MTEKKQWALNTAKSFYKEVEKRFKNVKTAEEAVEVFKSFFTSEKEFYKHVNRHIFRDIYQNEQKDWIEAKRKDEEFKRKFSFQYLQIFFKTLTKPSIILYQQPINEIAKPRTVIYSKLKTFAIVLERHKIISISFNEKKDLEEWKNERLNVKKLDKEIIEVGKDEEFTNISKILRSRIKQFIL